MHPPPVETADAPRSLRELPPFPPIALKVFRLLALDDTETAEIVGTLAADPVFSGELLHMANSPLFGLERQVKTLQSAVVILGRDRLRSVTMSVALRSYTRSPVTLQPLQQWWRHSLASALLADGLASACSHHSAHTYTAGLVHSIGRLGFMTLYPKPYAHFYLSAATESTLEAERSLFGLDHAEAGKLMMEDWGFPQELIAPAAHHHEELEEEETSLVTLVRLGCRLADVLGFHCLHQKSADEFDEIAAQFPEPLRGGMLLDPDILREAIAGRIRDSGAAR